LGKTVLAGGLQANSIIENNNIVCRIEAVFFIKKQVVLFFK
jgi:hypothetical protein